MAKKNNEIWIETCKNIDGTFTFNVGTEWGCTVGFKKNARKKVFEALKKAMNEVCPKAIVNPWIDDEYGTPDFE